jgi:ribosome maturation factor RimP
VFEKEKIVEMTNSKLAAFGGFLVDVVISQGNKIVVEIDSPEGISIGQCAELNRFLNAELDNETNEFELTVSSPGLEKPFKVFDQYKKNIDRQVKVKTIEGKEFEAKLKEVSENGILIQQRVKEKNEKNKKEWVERDIQLPFDQIKETKVILTFK